MSTKMVRRSILSSFLGKIRETPEKQNLMILLWMMRGPEALTSSSPLSFQLLFLFPSSASSRAEAISYKMAGLNPGGTPLRILRPPVINFIYVLSPWAQRMLPLPLHMEGLSRLLQMASQTRLSRVKHPSLCFERTIGASSLLERLRGVRSGDSEGC